MLTHSAASISVPSARPRASVTCMDIFSCRPSPAHTRTRLLCPRVDTGRSRQVDGKPRRLSTRRETPSTAYQPDEAEPHQHRAPAGDPQAALRHGSGGFEEPCGKIGNEGPQETLDHQDEA